MSGPYAVEAGRPYPLGATPDAAGVNFSLYAERATAIELLLFDRCTDRVPTATILLDPDIHRTFHFWHVYVRGLRPCSHYAYRVDGPSDLRGHGDRYNRNKVLADPYARGVTTELWERGAARGPDDNLATALRCAVIDVHDYDWEGDRPLNRPMHETIIYEMHVGGFTRSPAAQVAYPGTFHAVIEKLPYLQSLGITAVELLPICQFDATETADVGPHDGRPPPNYWGYSPIGFFAPHSGYCIHPEEARHLTEFRDMVKALHRAGIEVILDVVFNHTSEGDEHGPTIHLRGIENDVYYQLDPAGHERYLNFSGCGNTLNCNHPITQKLIVDALEFWVRDLHIDGFRFDEGSILARGEDGSPLARPPVIWSIELSETLAETKVIAEAWDATGFVLVGDFPGWRWAEWNGRFRDDIRRFVRGDAGMVRDVASRIAGSADIYQASGHLPINSINYVTCHDGFTLHDLVTYSVKHNEANGEGNRDGADENFSGNGGIEGETDDLAVNAYRTRQIKNFAAILLLSRGVPMLLGGDEIRRTQRGNNNAYCQDNPISWFDWTLVGENAATLHFFRQMIAFRRLHPVLHRDRFFAGAVNGRNLPEIAWHGCALFAPGWDDPASRVLSFTIGDPGDGEDIHVILNMDAQDLDFALPSASGRRWVRAVDTACVAPEDIVWPEGATPVTDATYRATSHSVVILVSR